MLLDDAMDMTWCYEAELAVYNDHLVIYILTTLYFVALTSTVNYVAIKLKNKSSCAAGVPYTSWQGA